ncbi:MAG: hypothetical protein M5U28_35210 [Sandaracinaceae bacterium]|nr:hypothetical protein [Sandaracinaceae bacterium]
MILTGVQAAPDEAEALVSASASCSRRRIDHESRPLLAKGQ